MEILIIMSGVLVHLWGYWGHVIDNAPFYPSYVDYLNSLIS